MASTSAPAFIDLIRYTWSLRYDPAANASYSASTSWRWRAINPAPGLRHGVWLPQSSPAMSWQPPSVPHEEISRAHPSN
jgi:hypothetical protein